MIRKVFICPYMLEKMANVKYYLDFICLQIFFLKNIVLFKDYCKI